MNRMLDEICHSVAAAPLPAPSGLETHRLSLADGAVVHVRTLTLDGRKPAHPADFETLLCPEERQRADRFLRPVHRAEYVAAHGLLRRMLGELLDIDPAALVFATPPGGGKPFLAEPSVAGLDINLSHTTGMVACAVAFGGVVGVDVEWRDRRVGIGVIRQVLTDDECRWVQSLPDSEQDIGFLRLWTLKEAVAKALGQGLSLSFSSVSVQPDPPRLLFLPPDGVTAWQLRQWRTASGHVAAVACHPRAG